MESGRRRSLLHWFRFYGGLAVYLLIAFAPIYWMALTSLRGQKQIYSRVNMLMPQNLTLDNYIYALTERPLLLWLANSLIVATLSCLVSLTISAEPAMPWPACASPAGRPWPARWSTPTWSLRRSSSFRFS